MLAEGALENDPQPVWAGGPLEKVAEGERGKNGVSSSDRKTVEEEEEGGKRGKKGRKGRRKGRGKEAHESSLSLFFGASFFSSCPRSCVRQRGDNKQNGCSKGYCLISMHRRSGGGRGDREES